MLKPFSMLAALPLIGTLTLGSMPAMADEVTLRLWSTKESPRNFKLQRSMQSYLPKMI